MLQVLVVHELLTDAQLLLTHLLELLQQRKKTSSVLTTVSDATFDFHSVCVRFERARTVLYRTACWVNILCWSRSSQTQYPIDTSEEETHDASSVIRPR